MSVTYELNEIVVVNHGGWQKKRSKAIVKKISPTGRITVELQESKFTSKSEIVFNPDGYERGATGYSRSSIRKGSEEAFIEIEKDILLSKFQSFFRTSGSGDSEAHDLPLNYLQRMWELVGAAKSDSA